MTITTNPSRDEYTSTAGQTVFNYTFKIYANTDLNVYVTPSGQSPDDSADLTTDYVVDTGTIGDEAGGFITFNTPLNNGDAVTIVSAIPYDRTVDYQNNGDFLPETVNDDNDRQVSQIKQILEQTGRTLQFQESLQGASTLSLPDPVSQNFMRWKTDLTGLENVELVDGALVVGNGQLLIFPTVAALKASTSELLVPGVNVQTQGYYSAGDGGGANHLIVTPQAADEYGDHTLNNGNVAVLQVDGIVSGPVLGMTKTGTDSTSIFNSVATSDNYDGIKLPSGSFGWSGNLFLSDGQMISGVGSGNTISGNKGSRLLPLSSDARIRLFPHSKLENLFVDGVYNGVDKAVDGIYLKPHELGDPDYESGDPVTASVIWTKVSNVNIQNFSNNVSIEGESFNLWFENLVSVAGRFKQVGGGESTLSACNLSDTTDQEILFNDGGKISVHGGAIQNTNGGYPCIVNQGKMLLQGVYMENARAGANNNGYLIDNYETLTLVQPKSMAISEKGIRGRAGSKTYLRDVEFTGNNANTNEVFNGRGDNNNDGGGYLYFENLTFRSCLAASINYIEHAIGGYSDKGYSIESGNEKTLYLNEGANLTDLTSSGGTLTSNDTAEYLTNGESLRFIAAASAPYITLTKTLRGLSGHLIMIRWAVLAKPSASDNTRFLANIGGDVTCSYVNVEFDADSANGNTDTWYYITTSAVLDPLLTEHTITCNLFTSLGGSGSSNGTNYIDRIELVDCGLVHKD